MFSTSRQPSGNSPIIFVNTAGGTRSTSGSSSLTSSGTSSTKVMRLCLRVKLIASFATIRRNHAFSEPSPLYSKLAIPEKSFTKLSCTTSSASSRKGTYLSATAMAYPTQRSQSRCIAARLPPLMSCKSSFSDSNFLYLLCIKRISTQNLAPKNKLFLMQGCFYTEITIPSLVRQLSSKTSLASFSRTVSSLYLAL